MSDGHRRAKMEGHAKRGGEQGVNGEWYKGGQFLPNSAYTVKGQQNGTKGQGKARKVEIAPYIWDVAPEGKCSIWAKVAGIVARYNRDSNSLEYAGNAKTLAYYGMTETQAQDLIARWNAGERWMDR